MWFGQIPIPWWIWCLFHPIQAIEEAFHIVVLDPIDWLARRVGLHRLLHISLGLNVLLAAVACAGCWF